MAVAVITLTAVTYPMIAIVVATTALLLGSLHFMRSRLAPLAFSPTALVAVGLYAMGVLGTTLYSSVQNAEAGAGALVILDADQTTRTFILLGVAAISLLVGSYVTASALPRISVPTLARTISISKNLRGWMLAGSAAPLLYLLIAGGTELWYRPYYIAVAVQDGGLAGIAAQLAIAAPIALGYLLFASGRGSSFMSAILLLGYIVLFFGGGSRKLAMLPILIMVGVFVAKRSKGAAVALLVAAIFSLYLIRLPLYLRALPEHGVVPYLNHLPGFLDYGVGWDSIALNVLVSFGIIGATAFQQPAIDPSVFWISVNPAPGATAGWYDQAESLRINVYTPYAGVGELGNYGMGYVIAYFLVAGCLLALLDRTVMRLMVRGHGVMSLALVAMAGLFLLYSVQYNLRSSSRMLIYGVILAVAISIVSGYMARRRPLDDVDEGALAERRVYTLR
ncbi:hypothetical protein ACIPY0_21100 [Paenarthrobacter nicotinovorans]|uniref:hypothetical protein n=1 Tax=Paenarthrobacter nicotinovorans TaxID=29320 RepID=UPI00381781D0